MNVATTESRRLRLEIFLYVSLGMWFVVLSAAGIFVLAKNLDETETEAAEEESAVVWLESKYSGDFSYVVGGDTPTNDELDEMQRAIATKLDASPLVKEHNYIGREETLVEIQQYFKDSPEIIKLIDSDAAPTSFVVTPEDDVALQDFGDFLHSLPNIDKVAFATPLPAKQGENWLLIGALAIPLSALVTIWLGFFILKPQKYAQNKVGAG